jgi:hypothetical protein
MAQGSSMDMSKLTTGEKIVLGSAGAYIVWAFIPVWYKFSLELGAFGAVSDSINGFRGVTLVAWILALVAVIEIVATTLMGNQMNVPVKRGVLHLALAVIALVLTLIGLASKPSGYGISWGIFVAILIALAWVYGAYMMYSAPESTSMSPPADSTGYTG